MNVIKKTDSYKLSHYKQYPKVSNVYSYFESRVGAKYPETIFFGLQYIIKKHLLENRLSVDSITKAKTFADKHMGPDLFNERGWIHILRNHNGRLPVHIKAVPEGTKVPTSNVLMTIENTDPKCYWLTNYLETLLCQVWYPSTVATVSNYVRNIILDGLKESGDITQVSFKLHDFGFRGASSFESAGIGGMAHLLNFMGTDTIPGIDCAMEYYSADLCGFSIPASEHSTITSWGENRELEAYENMLDQYPAGLVACVSDSYDLQRAVSEYWGKSLRDKVLAREGTLVIRPDSGDIVPTVIDVLTRAGESFGYDINPKGYKVLPPQVRMIQGDGCTPETIKAVIETMLETKWSVDNIAFGMGAGLLQKLDRDTNRYAFKCSSVKENGEEKDVWKKPNMDSTKDSKRGRLALIRNGRNELETVREEDYPTDNNLLQSVFKDGKLLVDQTFKVIQARAIK